MGNYRSEKTGAGFGGAIAGLMDSLRHANPDMREVGQPEDIRVNGVAGRSVDLIGHSSEAGEDGKAMRERDWLVAMNRNDGVLIYLVFAAPENDFEELRPVFEQTSVKSLKLK